MIICHHEYLVIIQDKPALFGCLDCHCVSSLAAIYLPSGRGVPVTWFILIVPAAAQPFEKFVTSEEVIKVNVCSLSNFSSCYNNSHNA